MMEDIRILDDDLGLVALMDDYNSVSWKRRFHGDSTFKVTVDPRSQNAGALKKKAILVMPDGDSVYMIEQVEWEQKEGEAGAVSALGKKVGMFSERITIPPSGQRWDAQLNVPAETALKHYVDLHCGPSAAVARRVPRLTVAPNLARGPAVWEQARYRPVLEIIERISINTAVGWDVFFDEDNGLFVFDIILGNDRTTEVFFDQDFDTVLSQKLLSTIAGRKTFAYLGAVGTGTSRAIVQRYVGDVEPTGLDRREMFIDAQEIVDLTTAHQRADGELAKTSKEDAWEFDYNPYGSFRYREHWDIGDMVTARNRVWGVEVPVRIIGVEETYNDNGHNIKIELGRGWPTIRSIQEQYEDLRSGSSYE